MDTLSRKKILVTGGVGFIGTNLVRTLVNLYHADVTVLDDLFNGNLANLKGINYRFVNGSTENKEVVNACVKGQDIVFHLAARNINISNINPREDLSVNVGGAFNVFEACHIHGVQRVVYCSTASIYGNPEKFPLQENDRTHFLSFYAASKYTAEVYAKTFYEVFDLPVTIVRYSNVYGPYQSPANLYCGVIGKFISDALGGRTIHIHGNGKQTRDYTYVDDAVNVTITAAMHPKALGEDYNIGTGRETAVNELAETILALTGSHSDIELISNRDIDNISRRCIDIGKSQAHLNYQPQYTLYKGLEQTINWFCQTLHKPVPAPPPAAALLE